MKIPKPSEIISNLNGKKEINWQRFFKFYKTKKNKREERCLDYHILFLIRTGIVAQLPENPYVIFNNNSGRKIVIKNREIKYGFCKREDALNYTKIARPRDYTEFTIDTLENLTS